MANVKTLKVLLKASLEAQVTPMVWGKHGIGKSAIVKQIGKEMKYDEVIDLRLGQMEVGDLIGMPDKEYSCPKCDTNYGIAPTITHCIKCDGVELIGKTVWLPPSWFPTNGESRLLFFDELNRGRLDVQQAAFQIVLDRRIHTHKIPDNCGIICACNPSGGDYYVQELDPALLDRFINIKFTLGHSEWLEWARSNDIAGEVIDFIGTDSRHLGNESIEIPIEITPSPRSYEFLSRLLRKADKQYWHEIATCVLGNAPAIAFAESMKRNIEKPVRAAEIFDNFRKKEEKVATRIKQQVKASRSDLLRVTCDEIENAFADGKSTKYTADQLNNVADFLVLLMDDLAFAVLKTLATIPDINNRLLLDRPDLFEMLKKANQAQKS